MDVLSPGGLALIYIYIFFSNSLTFCLTTTNKSKLPWGEGQERASMDLKKPPCNESEEATTFFYTLCIQAHALVKLVSFSGAHNLFFLSANQMLLKMSPSSF